jgi:multiple sugar transport system permease protein
MDARRLDMSRGAVPIMARRLLGPDWRVAALFVGPMVLLLAGLVALPFVDAIWLSFTTLHIGNVTTFVGLRNYTSIWNDKFFRDAVANSVVFTAYSEMFKVLIGLLAALLLHNLRRGRAVLTGLVLLPWIVPTIVSALAWRSLYDPIFGGLNVVLTGTHVGPLLQTLHLVDRWPATWLGDGQLAMPAVIAVNVWKGIPFFTINFLAGLKAISPELSEAAAVDGATAWRRFLHVTLPGLRYVILVTVLLSTIWTFNTFDLIWLLTQGGPGDATAPYVLFAYAKAIQQLQFGPGSAVALTMLPVTACLVFVLARYLLRSEQTAARPGWPRRLGGGYGRPLAVACVVVLAVLLYAMNAGLFWKCCIGLGVIVAVGLLYGRLADTLRIGSRIRGARELLGRAAIWIAMGALLALVLTPFYWIVVTAFKSDLQATIRTSPLWPSPWTFDQFTNLLGHNPFWTWYRNTTIVATASTLLALVFSAMAGYALARLRFRGAQGLAGVVLLTYVLPSALLFVPLYRILSDLHLVNTLWALVVAYPTFTIPFASWLLMSFFRSIPAELEEAAFIDGASRLQAFWRIVLPLAKPALLAVALFTFTNAWNEFLFAFVFLTNDQLMTLPVGMQSMIFGDIYPWGQLMAASILITVPVVVLYAYAQRFLVEGLTLGAVKA